MGATISTLANALKNQYEDDIQDFFEEGEGIVPKITARKKAARGGDHYLLARTSRSGAVGFRGDGDTLPTASNQGWQQHSVTPKALYGRVQVSGLAMDRASGNKAEAFVEAWASESEHVVGYMKKRAAMRLWGGQEGYLGELSADPSTGTTLTLQGPSRTGAWDNPAFNNGTRFVPWAGEFAIDIIDSDGSTVHQSGLTVSSVDHSAGTLEIGSAAEAAIAAGDFVVVDNPDSTHDSSGAWEGLIPAIDDGTVRTTYHGLSRTTYPVLKSNVLSDSSANRPLTDSLLEDLCQTVFVNSGKDPSMGSYEIVVDPYQYARYVSTLLPVKRFNTQKVSGGHAGGLDFNGINIVRDQEAPYGCAYLIDWDQCMFLETTPLGFRTFDGTQIMRQTDVDSYEARLVWYGNLLVKNVHCMGVLRNLEASSAYLLRS